MIKASVDDRELKRSLKEFSKKLNKTAEDAVIDLAKVGSTQLAHRVQPYGTGKKSEDILTKAVYKDVNKAYMNTGRVYNEIKKTNPNLAAAYAEAVNGGELTKAEDIAKYFITGFEIEPMDSGTHLERSRNSHGRVTETNPVGVTDNASLERVKAKKALTAGTAKAGFLQAGASLRAKTRIPKWLKKGGRLGSSRIVKRGWSTVVWLINHVTYASSVMSNSTAQAAIANAYRNNLKRLQKQVDALAKKT